MKELFKKHWITFLGSVFMFMAFSYMFKFAVDQGWISNEIKIGIGILVGAGFAVIGAFFSQKGKDISGQILSGTGVALFYTTFSFAGIVFDIWTPMTVFLSMIAVTIGVSIYAFRLNLRIMMNLALLGALISPLVMEPQGDQVFTLFLYLLVINSAFFFVSVCKRWTELRLIPFMGTWILYAAYYLHFDPVGWEMPFKYAVSAFLFYIVGLLISSWKENLKFDGLNMYLGVLNGGVFALWAFAILHGQISFSVILTGMGIIYLTASLVIYLLTRQYSIAVVAKFFGGLLLALIAAADLGSGLAVKPMISVYTWMFVAILVLMVGQIKKLEYLKLAAIVIWFGTGFYWFSVTWTTPLGIWFGKFIPVLNWSGMAWVLLAAFGFYLSLNVRINLFYRDQAEADYYMSNIFAILSHLVVGGLLTFQIDNLWEEYTVDFIDLGLTLSVSWGIYALILFIWGAYSKQAVFRWFGSAVLVIVALKTLFINLNGSETIYKVLVLFILGIITFGISLINNMWKGPHKVPEQNMKNIDNFDPVAFENGAVKNHRDDTESFSFYENK
ncbi:MAG: DUF2339 domain-containing protein [Clostridia bacterium]|nr:DUF2339 domain-containing protein [Clostridia bacterium]